MGKQSARLYYRNKDHKDIYFQGKFHNAMYVCKDNDEKLLWRKLYDEGCCLYRYWNYSFSGGYSYSYAILYPKHKIREQRPDTLGGKLRIGDKCCIMGGDYSPVSMVYISVDGKLWKKCDMKQFGSAVRHILPKWNGMLVGNALDSYGKTIEWTYCPIKDGELNISNACVIYNDSEHGTESGNNNVYYYNGIPDMFIFTDSSGRKLTAVDMDGSIHDLFTLNVTTNLNGRFDGIYWIWDTEKGSGSKPYKTIVRTSRNPYGEWGKQIIAEGTGAYWDVRIVTARDCVVIYQYYNTSTPITAKYTADFVNFTEVGLPDNLLIPVIGEKPSGFEYDYINVMIKPGVKKRDDSYNIELSKNYRNIFPAQGDSDSASNSSDYAGRCIHGYVENQKLCPSDSIVFTITYGITSMSRVCLTCYIDNLFFRESDNNFAFCEQTYPQQYMNDYT